MCGFAGELRLDGRPADVGAVARMNATMERRGPDGGGVWQRGPLALAHRRLTIIDLSQAGAQPMIDSELGLSLVFNGCIYNYRELRAELEAAGYRFFSTSDTEVILKAYHRWGPACVERFHGMFAFVVAERDTGRVAMARDRLGIKPLYLARMPGRLRFASTLPALLAGGDVDTGIDRTALHHYMTFHSVVPAPLTILKGVRKLPPATVRTIEADGTEKDRVYWRPSFTRGGEGAIGVASGPLPSSAGEWQETLLDRLRVAARRRRPAGIAGLGRRL
jgi:asparagine synthase (glutamine-hydrolysing)